MKFVIAPDSYKSCLRAAEVVGALETGIRQCCPEADVLRIPLADGGEGTVEAAAQAAGGKLESTTVSDPVGRPVEACYALLPDGTAVLEMASAAGIELLAPEELNPMHTSTFGVGELLNTLLDNGIRDFVIGLGGSATVDGGIGMLQALGGRFRDREGKMLPPGAGGEALCRTASADLSGLRPELAECRFRIASDVTNPLGGPTGAATVFGPQKGATPEQITRLDDALRRWAVLWNDDGTTPGDGAAGGIGFAFRRILGGRMASGAELLLELADFDRRAAGADWIITGEGRTDRQSLGGKLCGIVAQHANRINVPIILVSGALAPDLDNFTDRFAACFSIASGPGELAEALTAARVNLIRMGRNIAALTSLHNMDENS